MFKCMGCKKGPLQGVAVYRVNAKGEPGKWACLYCITKIDTAPPIDPVVQNIVETIQKG